MRYEIRDLNEITDSIELLEAKPHKFTSIFIYIIALILLSALTWSYFSKIDVVVKADGVLRPNDEISTIKNIVTGKVKDIYFRDGQSVKQGQILYTIEHNELILQQKTIEKTLKEYKKEYSMLTKFKKSISENKNYFDSKSENEYYNKYLKYETDYAALKCNLEKPSLEMNQTEKLQEINRKNIQNNIESLEKESKNLALLQQCIEQNENLFTEQNEKYYNQFLDYKLNLDKLDNTYQNKLDYYEKLKVLEADGIVSTQELQNTELDMQQAKTDLSKYKNEYLLSIKKSIQDNNDKQKNLVLDSGKTEKNSEMFKNNSQSYSINIKKYKTDALVKVDNEAKDCSKKIKTITAELEKVKLDISNCIVKSPINGFIRIVNPVTKGDFIPIDMVVASILPKNNSKYKVELYVSNKDIANLKEKQIIKYHFSALPYKEYGELKGEITKISIDSQVNPNTGLSFYLVEANIQNKPLYSYKGKKAEIKLGMQCQAHVITRQKRILYYLLEKLNLKD
ncbi:HlyD family efflux transporter periplasmic adaptor subunit [Clostridium sp. ZS2-4]|uniref:HlyD family efflux transporter periplasmic adaptor subunit n=1 Tax=Clostridium sp. ZS2-4 TaxID=2987703 RepID=UPI00227CC9EF|nr:HlyD family efflux transporter periplasmic adaptor subunit [Clostridium sp. ZS2-4]MCY6355559.1 HlyD family efflux transporter periplasmic adaptor subunit [Clostridium sp. ZS2-4]